ncbi:hypothetical protein RvY_18905-2 [Ramazzottius varieornatus]|uniref:Ion transport domain-containing protein n=1 Tax=Ramazzottius varieornatus TaxID=947166 RepID=A0A1D1W7I1_RAMVA|nr:hypothetical protein RvY_18905-2 [Ramazzottius varieornatus]
MFGRVMGKDRCIDGPPSSANIGRGSLSSCTSASASPPFQLEISLSLRRSGSSRRPARPKKPSSPPLPPVAPAPFLEADVAAATAAPSASVFPWPATILMHSHSHSASPVTSLPSPDNEHSPVSADNEDFYSLSSRSTSPVPSRTTVSPGSQSAYSPHRLSSADERDNSGASLSTASSPLLDALGRLARRKNPQDVYARYHAEKPKRLNMSLSQSSHSAWDMLYFIAGGHHFSCPEWILSTHPETLLGNADKRQRYFSASRGCYVFPDTLPDVFSAVLEYYEGQILTRPGRIGLKVYLEQVDLFQIDPMEVRNLLIREGIRFEHFDHGHTHINYSLFKHPLHQQIWDILENPETSTSAKFISALSMGLTVLSVMLFCLETLPELSYLDVDGAGAYSVARNPIFILNTICVIYFSVELLLRFVVCPDKALFAKQWMNWVDLFAVVPYFVTLSLVLGDINIGTQTSKLAAVRVIRLFRILRIFDLSRHYKLKSVGVLVQAIRANLDIIAVLIFLLFICDILFSGFIYAVEGGANNTFTSIPDAFW